MRGYELFERLKAKSKEREREIIERREYELKNMSEAATITYLEKKIQFFEEQVMIERKKGKDDPLSGNSLFLEFYTYFLDILKRDPKCISELKNIIICEEKSKAKFNEIRLKRLLKMNLDQHIKHIEGGIQLIHNIIEDQKSGEYWLFPVSHEKLETDLINSKNILKKLKEDPNYISEYKSRLKDQLIKEMDYTMVKDRKLK